MARYGNVLYDQAIYGVGTETNLLWGCEVDWLGSGFTGRNEGNRMTSLITTRGRRYFIQQNGKGLVPVDSGVLTIKLDNSSGDYDPFNTSSPLYPNVEPGKYIRITVKNGESGTTKNVFAGKIEDIVPIHEGSERAVLITAYDGMKLLSEGTVTTPLKESIGTGAAVSEVLSRIDWPDVWGSTIETGSDTIDYWCENGTLPSTAIDRISQREYGKYFVAADGQFKFKQRSSLTTAVTTIDQSEMLKDIQMLQPWEVVRNVVKINVYPKLEQTAGVLWTLNDKPLIKAGTSLPVWGTFTYQNRPVFGTDVENPTATTDYTMNTAIDGSGTDKTSEFTVTDTVWGQSIKRILTAGASDAYVTLCQVRGTPIDTPNSTFIEVDNASGSQKRAFELDTPWMQTVNVAYSRANYIDRILNQTKIFPRFQIESRPDKQFEFDLFDKITVTMAKYGVSADYLVGFIEHQWLSETGQSVLTTVYTEPAPSQSGYWTFPMTFPTKFP